jgi:hypothetical protein
MAIWTRDSTELTSIRKLTPSKISRQCTRNIHSLTNIHAASRSVIGKITGIVSRVPAAVFAAKLCHWRRLEWQAISNRLYGGLQQVLRPRKVCPQPPPYSWTNNSSIPIDRPNMAGGASRVGGIYVTRALAQNKEGT